jgi:predicted MFS family arabinose efflux permease
MNRFQGSRIGQVLAYRDFRLLWIGAFVSFTGSWISNIARGYYVFRITGDESKLGLITFVWSLPVCIFGLFAGSAADMFNKRVVLVVAQLILGLTTTFLGIAIWNHFIQYWQILLVALLNGLVSCVEMPTRQSILSDVVPSEVLPAAVPINAMTFNVARVMGPAIGAVVLSALGTAWCFILDGLSYLAIIGSVLGIRANLEPKVREPQPLIDLIMEGAIYTFRDRRLRTLFVLESLTATFAMAYLPLLPAFVEDVLKQGIIVVNGHKFDQAKAGLGYAYGAVGVGSILGLMLAATLADMPHKANLVRGAMLLVGISLPLLSICSIHWLAYILLAMTGGAIIIHLNTTNSLFQTLSPERLRGRVLAMHIWAVNGISPFGVLLFGWLARATRVSHVLTLPGRSYSLPSGGVSLVMQIGGGVVLLGGIAACFARQGLSGLHHRV